MDDWLLEWDRGRLRVLADGAMLSGVQLNLGGGRLVAPFYEAPWLDEGHELEPKLLENLRSEFPCVPFGGTYPLDSVMDEWKPALTYEPVQGDGPLDASDELLHGPCCLGTWELVDRSATHVTIAIDYPSSSIISRLVRTVRCKPGEAAIGFSLTVHARRKGRRPIGLHPNIAFPSIVGALRVVPGDFVFGAIHPAGPEAGVSRAQAGGFFDDLAHVPLAAGGYGVFDRLPFAHDTEEILQLCGADGSVRLEDRQAGAAYQLQWDADVLPCLQLWMSNRGRKGAPWNGRNMCLGVEPLAGVFDLGTRAALAPNPINARAIPTAALLDPAAPLTVQYRFAAQLL